MLVTFELPNNIERRLRQLGDLDQVAKEATLVELYRQENLTHHELAQALGLSRIELDEVLKKHNVTEDLMTIEQFLKLLKITFRRGNVASGGLHRLNKKRAIFTILGFRIDQRIVF